MPPRATSPCSSYRRAAAARARLIEHIVVHERGHVDHLADAGGQDVGLAQVARGRSRAGEPAQDHQGGAEHLAPVAFDVGDELRDRGQVAVELLIESSRDAIEVRAHALAHGRQVGREIENALHSGIPGTGQG